MLNKETVARVATLARIKIAEDELENLALELAQIVTWIEQLNEVETDHIAPMSRMAKMKLPMREDNVTESNQRAAILKIAPEATASFFTVPKVVE